MLGAIAGDIIGSPYEGNPIKTTEFPLFAWSGRFTDDTVLTVAVAEVLLDGSDYAETFHRYFDRFPDAGYGGTFFNWARSHSTQPYRSYGNGSAMRVSPVGWAFDSLEETLAEAARSAAVTHDHPEGIKGAQATAAAIYLARGGADKQAIADYVERTFGYDVSTPLSVIWPRYHFDVTCQGTVPVAMRAFLEGRDWEEAVRLAVGMGGDSDTLACITGSIAEAFHGGIPESVEEHVREMLTTHAPSLLEVVDEFVTIYVR